MGASSTAQSVTSKLAKNTISSAFEDGLVNSATATIAETAGLTATEAALDSNPFTIAIGLGLAGAMVGKKVIGKRH